MKLCAVNWGILDRVMKGRPFPLWVRMTLGLFPRKLRTLRRYPGTRHPVVGWAYVGERRLWVDEPKKYPLYAIFWYKSYDDPYTWEDRPHEAHPFGLLFAVPVITLAVAAYTGTGIWAVALANWLDEKLAEWQAGGYPYADLLNNVAGYIKRRAEEEPKPRRRRPWLDGVHWFI